MGSPSAPRGSLRRFLLPSLVLAIGLTLFGAPASAETIEGALVKAYLNNPDVNQQRAAVRVVDEDVPKAASGFRPKVGTEVDSPLLQGTIRDFGSNRPTIMPSTATRTKARGIDVTVDENAWNGNRTLNSVREADSRVLGAREQLRNTEQNVLMDGVTAYMNVLRDTAILMLQRAHVHVESEEVREARDRFKGGEVTITDVEQAKAALARAEADALVADSTLRTSIAEYRKVIGEEPVILQPAKPIAEALPKSVADAIAISQAEHPAITAALHGVDTSELRIALEEGRLYPSIDLAGLFDRRFNAAGDIQPPIPQTLSLTGTVSVPLYDGGLAYAATRQAKEQLAQQELTVYAERERVRASVVSAWARNTAAPGLLRAAYSQVAAAELAVIGVREEAKDGERTTLDEIVAEQTLLRARIQLVSAQRDAVVSSYAMLSAIGRLSTIRLALRVNPYNAAGHYAQVKDKWFGLRTPDGR